VQLRLFEFRFRPVVFSAATLLGASLFHSHSLAETRDIPLRTTSSTNAPAGLEGTNAAAAADPVERDYLKLLEEDNAAQTEVDAWIEENERFAEKGAPIPPGEMRQRILKRFGTVRKSYEAFLERHPNHVRGRIAYASFLGDIGDEESSRVELEKALPLDPKNPAIYNNLANIHGHIGPVKKAFEYYARAIELKPDEPVYHHNLGTTVYLFRKDAMEYYGITEQQVFNKALDSYRRAMELDPKNFPLASDFAQSYYGIEPRRTEDALIAWTNALNIARDDVEREGVYIHFARLKLGARRFDEAQAHLSMITNTMYLDLRHKLERNLKEQREKAEAPAPAAK
jgi:tetratricopeptide (TPR) repeat protein